VPFAPVAVRRLAPPDAPAYRALMLAAYADAPDAFTATVEERAALPPGWWARRLAGGPDPAVLVVGAFDGASDGERLVGVAGLRHEVRPRTAHKSVLFGMAVRPEARGRGVGRALVEAVVAHARARPGTEVVTLTVTEGNASAQRLYAACGFRAFGTEPLAIRTDGGFAAKVHMWLPVGA
jgi:ribosomal protein S18 acetylase RimI-like enzyme